MSGRPLALLAPFLLVGAALVADPLPPDRMSIYAATASTHATHPYATAVRARIISGGGSGMGSRPNMSFTQAELPVAYSMYGRKGETACVDVEEPHNVTVAGDGQTINWTAHGFGPDQPLFVTGAQSTLWFVFAPSITADSFKLSALPYHAPGVRDPYVAHTFGASATFELNAYAHCVLGGNGGGIIGDQAFAGQPIKIYFGNTPYPRSMYWYGEGGANMLGGGARGGNGGKGTGGAQPQIGGLAGNAGTDLEGGGGSGAGFMNPDNSYPITQWGPGSGAGGTMAEISLPLKPSYKFHAPGYVLGGEPGTNGFRGGRGGMGLVMFIETIGLP